MASALAEASRRGLSLNQANKVSLIDPDPVRWITANFRIPETPDKRIVFHPYQAMALKQAMQTDENGNFLYSVILWGDIKKSAKCLHPDTLVLMADWTQKRAGDIQPGDKIKGYDFGEFSGSVIDDVVSAVEIQPAETTTIIETSRGRRIETSAAHPVLIGGEKGRCPSYARIRKSSAQYRWKQASSIQPGDRVVIGMGERINPDDIALDLEFYSLGVYIGDGCNCTIANSTPEIHNRISKVFETHQYVNTEHGHYSLKGIVAFLRAFEMGYKKTAYTKEITNAVLGGTQSQIVSFLSGYIDTDGCVNHPDKTDHRPTLFISSVNRPMLEACQRMFERIGVNASLRPHNVTYKGQPYLAYNLIVSDKSQIVYLSKILRLAHPGKLERLMLWANKIENDGGWTFDTFKTDRVSSVYQSKEPRETVAIEVRDTQVHITGGIVTHNSSLAAAIALWRAFQVEWGSIYIIANDLKQADSRVFYYMRRALELNPILRERVKITNYRMTLDNKTFIEAIPIDPSGEAGSNADGLFWSELWGSHQKSQEKMFAEMTLSPMKFGKSFRWIETYAGYVGESPLLERLYQTGVIEGEQFGWCNEFDPALEAYENQSARMFALWNRSPRLEWQTKEYYASEAAVLAENEFKRMHRNEWVSSSQTFVPGEWWNASRDTAKPMTPNESVILAMDAAISGDCFGLLMLSGRGGTGEYDIRYARAWKPPKGGKLDFGGEDGPERELRRLLDRYNVIEIAYDPYQLEDMASRLTNELLGLFYAFNQGAERAVADKSLRDMIRERRIRHDGSYHDLDEHIMNANSKTEGEKMRIVKKAEHMKIDLCVCLSMAAARASYWSI